MNNLRNNGQISILITNTITYESLQLKGKAIGWRPANALEKAILNEMLPRLRPLEYPDNAG
jgi:hypothetical protein